MHNSLLCKNMHGPPQAFGSIFPSKSDKIVEKNHRVLPHRREPVIELLSARARR